MGFATGKFAKLWSIEQKSQTWAKVQLSTSRKDRDTGEYETDFSGFVDFMGSANVQSLARHNEGDRIVLGDVDVTTRYDKEKKINYTNYKCYSFSEIDGSSPKKTATKKAQAVDDGEIDEDEDYPFDPG